ncbi:MAG: DUF455 family protein, partial [Gemmatimonadales bacterium]
MTSPTLPPLDSALFGDPPARDSRFQVVERWAECHNLPEGHPEKAIEFFHRQMNEELNVLENVARSLADFPEADWEVRMYLARQAADEARHVINYRRILEKRGGKVGQYPVMNFQFRILGRIPTLVGRLAVQNRTFEADGLDAVTYEVARAGREGDTDLLAMYESQQADEVFHVRFANEHIKRELSRNPRTALQVAAALTHGSRAFQQVFSGGGLN